MTTGRYDHLSTDELIALLERRDATRRYGLVWEREGIEADRASNDDFVVLDLDEELSTPPQDARGWRNLVIEGDNWDVLRALRAAYVGRVRCILIDPPYNTGNRDFVYNDRFVGAQDRYRQSTWLEFLYRRLVLARDLLAYDGVILVCINDENRARLDLLMEHVFPGMRIGSFVWRTKDTANNSRERSFSSVHEHIVIYGGPSFKFLPERSASNKFRRLPGDTQLSRLDPMTMAQDYLNRPNTFYPIYNGETDLWYPCSPLRVWSIWSEQKPTRKRDAGPSLEVMMKAGRVFFPVEDLQPHFFSNLEDLLTAIDKGDGPKDGKGRPLLRRDIPDLQFWVNKRIAHGRPSIKTFLGQGATTDVERPISSWMTSSKDLPSTTESIELMSERQGVGTDTLMQIFGDRIFDFPKPPGLMAQLVASVTRLDDIVLDFFAGSGTTAHAVLTQNAEDDGNRRFIVVSSTEAMPEASQKNLCRDVCAKRIRRVISGYGSEPPRGGDFAYLRSRCIPWASALYETGPQAVWILLQLAYDRPLAAFQRDADVQISRTTAERPEDPALAYVCQNTDNALATIRALAAAGPVTLFSAAPGALRDRLGMPELSIEAVPDRLLARFPQNVLGARPCPVVAPPPSPCAIFRMKPRKGSRPPRSRRWTKSGVRRLIGGALPGRSGAR